MPTFEMSVETKERAPWVRAARFLASGVCLLRGRTATGHDWAMTVNTVTIASLDPPNLAVFVPGTSRHLSSLGLGQAVTVAVLRASDAAIARRFSGRDSGSRDEAAGASDPLASFGCEVSRHLETGDHVLVLLEVRSVMTAVGAPLLSWRGGLYGLLEEHRFLESAEAFADFVTTWRNGSLPAGEWTHAAHVAVAAGYAHAMDADQVYRTMREGILHFNRCIGGANTDTSGYHDTLTRFWSETLSRYVVDRDFATAYEAACAAVKEFGSDRDLHRVYYDFDVVADRAARRSWVAPNRLVWT